MPSPSVGRQKASDTEVVRCGLCASVHACVCAWVYLWVHVSRMHGRITTKLIKLLNIRSKRHWYIFKVTGSKVKVWQQSP